jgi:NAD+ synthase
MYDKINEHIVEWLLNYASNCGATGFVIGISGGIDSAVTSKLCAQTGLTTLCVEMPIHQDPAQFNRAKEHISKLKSEFDNVKSVCNDLSDLFDGFKNMITESSPSHDLSLANTRARLRMTTLYYHAGLNNLLVAGTGNKVEDFGVGFYTKYGDGGVDLSPIADLMKSEVYKLAKHLNIIESIQSATPTDGLFGDSRSDEDQLGASYDELEWAMVEDLKGRTSYDFSGRQMEVFRIYKRLNTMNQHKMIPIPICTIPDNLR